jgi:hypothetical protein
LQSTTELCVCFLCSSVYLGCRGVVATFHACDCEFSRHISSVLLAGDYRASSLEQLSASIETLPDSKGCPHVVVAPAIVQILEEAHAIKRPETKESDATEPNFLLIRESPLVCSVLDQQNVRATVIQKQAGVYRLHCLLCNSRRSCKHIAKAKKEMKWDEQFSDADSDPDDETAEHVPISNAQPIRNAKPVSFETVKLLQPHPCCSCMSGPHKPGCTALCSKCNRPWSESKVQKVNRNDGHAMMVFFLVGSGRRGSCL